MGESEQGLDPWVTAEQSPEAHDLSTPESMVSDREAVGFSAARPQTQRPNELSHEKLGIGERAFSAAGAAFLSAIIVNPLDVVKVTGFSISLCFFFLLVNLINPVLAPAKMKWMKEKETNFLGFTIVLD